MSSIPIISCTPRFHGSLVGFISFDCWAFLHLPLTSELSSNTKDLLDASLRILLFVLQPLSILHRCVSFECSIDWALRWQRFYYLCSTTSVSVAAPNGRKVVGKEQTAGWKHKSSQYQVAKVVLFLWVAVSLLLLSPLYAIKRMILPSLCIQLPLHLVAYSKIMRPPSALWKAQSSVQPFEAQISGSFFPIVVYEIGSLSISWYQFVDYN